jgi:thioredoxin reductase (NADPH)
MLWLGTERGKGVGAVADEYDVIVAGGGIAGLTAGVTSARLGRTTLVLTGGAPGGLLLSIEKIEGYPGFPDGVSGFELCPLTQEQAAVAGASFSMAELQGVEPDGEGWRVSATDGDHLARAVVVATGARLRELGVPGEEALRGRGVSHCASCDAPLFRERVVGVVGGGDSALQEALTLADAVGEVIVLHRGESLTAQASFRDRVLSHPRISIRYRTVIEEILGEGALSGVRTRDLATDDVVDLELGGLFVYVGLEPNTEAVAERLRLDDSGHIAADAQMRTELAGLLAAGIVRRGAAGRAAGSAGDGAVAAVAADRFLADGVWVGDEAFAQAAAAGNGGSDG